MSGRMRAGFERQGEFWVRYGPAHAAGVVPCQHKLCFAATDADALYRLLRELSERADCFFVKLDAEPGPHGMVRGRCFLTSADAVGALWREHKWGEQVICSVQDDDFTLAHRAADAPAGADAVIAALGLELHPEGGAFVETWRAPAPPGERAAGTAIYFLLRRGERSRWHRIDSAEVWHFYAGDPLALSIGGADEVILGRNLAAGHRPQRIVPPNTWQTARTLGDWTLVGCTVSPAFEFDRFEVAPDGWEPGTRS